MTHWKDLLFRLSYSYSVAHPINTNVRHPPIPPLALGFLRQPHLAFPKTSVCRRFDRLIDLATC